MSGKLHALLVGDASRDFDDGQRATSLGRGDQQHHFAVVDEDPVPLASELQVSGHVYVRASFPRIADPSIGGGGADVLDAGRTRIYRARRRCCRGSPTAPEIGAAAAITEDRGSPSATWPRNSE